MSDLIKAPSASDDLVVDPSNAESARAWDGDEGAYWAEHADEYDRSLAAHHARLLAAAAIAPTDRVLDLGCGTGQLTRDAARRASAGSALGVDLSARMLEVARARAHDEGVGNAEFAHVDAQMHPFAPAAFDLAVSRTGTMFFGDPLAAFTNVGNALRAGGRLVQLTWQHDPGNEWLPALATALAGGREVRLPPPDVPGPYALSGPRRVRTVLEAAGFIGVDLESAEAGMWFGADADRAHAFILGQLGWMLRDADDATRARALDALHATMADHETPDGVIFASMAWIIRAERPGRERRVTAQVAGSLYGFADVDATAASGALVAALDELAAFPAVQRLRIAGLELLQPRTGATVAEIGCGVGDVLLQLAAAVGPTGRVVGIEASDTMLAEARRRMAERSLPVTLRQGDAARLELDDATFDGVWCERVFQHLDDADTAMAELVRVVRPGGRVVVLDTDWGMHAIHGADERLTARVVDCWAAHAARGWSGRELPARLVAAGIPDPTVVAETITSTDGARATGAPFTRMAEVAEEVGALDADEAAAWLAQLAAAGRGGQFFWAATMFAVGGRRPGTW